MDISEVIKNIRFGLASGRIGQRITCAFFRYIDGETTNRNRIKLQDTLWGNGAEK